MFTDFTLRPLSLSQVLDRTFSLYRKNFVLFAGIGALPPALVLVGQLLILAVGFAADKADSIKSAAGLVAAGLGSLGFFGLALVGYALAAGASVFAVSRVHLGYRTTIIEAYKLMLPRLGPILGIVVLVFLAVTIPVGIAVGVLIVPFVLAGVFKAGGPSGAALAAAILFGLLAIIGLVVLVMFLSAKLSLSVAACVLEGRGVIDSIQRSWSLTEGAVLRLIVVFILAGVISGALSAVLSIPYFIGMVLVITKKDPSALTPFIAWQYFAGFLAKALAGPIATIAVPLIYYDQRVRKEAFDLQLMMETINQPPPAQPAPPLIG